MSAKILVVDDESNILDVCTRYLERDGYTVITAEDGEKAIAVYEQESPDLVVLDLMLPKKSGWEVCEEMLSRRDIPVIMLTARGEESDRLMGLTMGADDYMTKPFSPRELVLRVKAILRRQQRSSIPKTKGDRINDDTKTIKFPDLEIHTLNRTVTAVGRTVELTVKEFELLSLLASHPEQVFSRNQLLSKVWDIDYYGDTTTVTVHIRRLREKIEPNPSQPKFVKTVWGIGYKFDGREPS